MAITDKGSHLTFTSTIATGYNGNVNVPAGTNCAVIAAVYYKHANGINLGSSSLGGVTLLDIKEESSVELSMHTHLAYAPNPTTGAAVNFTLVWDANPGEGPVVYVYFFDGVDVGGTVVDGVGSATTDNGSVLSSGALSGDSGDAVVAIAASWQGATGSWSSVTEQDEDVYNSLYGAFAYDLSISGNVTVGCDPAASWSSLAAGVLNAAAAGGAVKELLVGACGMGGCSLGGGLNPMYG